MAANSQCRGIANLGKRFVNQISTGGIRDPARVFSSQVSAPRRGVHVSAYDREIDDQLRPVVVPDHVIEPPSEHYWAPHPQTGVFGPPAEHISAAGERGLQSNAESSVLELKAWFRPQEGVEKPQHF